MMFNRTTLKSLCLTLILFFEPSSAFAAHQTKTQDIKAQVKASPLDQKIAKLIPLLKGRIKPAQYFAPSFLAVVPSEKFSELSQSLIAQYGNPLKVDSITKENPQSANVKIVYAKAIAIIHIVIDPTANNCVSGLLISDMQPINDSIAKIEKEFSALHGRAAFQVQTIDNNGSGKSVESKNADQIFAIGSTFKLYILAELTDEINAGQRSWSDVVPLSQRSFSSPATKKWPKDSPVTLQTLATWMISVSDNSAADTLLHVLGRDAVEQKLAMIGHSNPEKMLPFLSTTEAFALKSPSNAALRNRFVRADETEQRAILESQSAQLGLDQVDPNAFNNGPAYIDQLEWFANANDLSKLLYHIRMSKNETALQIMAVNSGIPASNKEQWRYLGYKGGSEPGVISMSFLLQRKDGQWMTASGSWNDPQKAVDENVFASLMARLLSAVAQ